MGVEEELQVVDRETGDLVPRSSELLPLAERHLGDRVTSELNRCQIETATGIHDDLGELRAELEASRRAITKAGEEIRCDVLAAGSHPWSSWQDQEIYADKARYREMEDKYQRLARRQVICGCHVHVGIDDPDRVVALMTWIRPWLPVLAALAANSPFWEGEDTGYDSYRLEVWSSWPTARMPPALADRAAYDEVVDQLCTSGGIEDATHLYWHARPSDRYPTLELRIMDVCREVDDAVAIAGLARGLVRAGLRQGTPQPDESLSTQVLDGAVWQAARYGLGGDLVSPRDLCPRPAGQVVAELLDEVGDDLAELGDRAQVEELVGRILCDGNGATRQRREAA
jgi:glutamate---cysteine ligase / carboxylate-amine ligase